MASIAKGAGAVRQEGLEQLKEDLEELRRVADHSPNTPAALLEPELDEAVSMLLQRFRPREGAERMMASAFGGARLSGLVEVMQDQIERRIRALDAELAALRADGDGPGPDHRLSRLLYEAGALVDTQLEIERWLIANAPGGAGAEGAATHCEWCGADYPVPGE